jgi:hypothetical protein
MRSALPDRAHNNTHDEDHNASTTNNVQIEKMLGGPTNIVVEEGCIDVGVQGHTDVEGVIRDHAGAGARMKQRQSWDTSYLAYWMEILILTREDMEGG